jgi:replicative DNA helicase
VAYALGTKAIKRLCIEQNALTWQKAKLSPALFKPYEQPMYEWVSMHLKMHHALPHPDTLQAQFPEVVPVDVPEPSSYYLLQLERQYCYERVNRANLESQAILKDDQEASEEALNVLRGCIRDVTEQRYRVRILDVAKDAPELVLTAYMQTSSAEYVATFGWPYMDQQSGGVMPGDVISFVGRPAVGKTWLTLWTAMHNWTVRKLNVLYVSMEMMTLPIAQRITALYTHQNISQLKMAGYSNQTFAKFFAGLKAMQYEEAKMYVVDGNLATSVEDLFGLADMLQCKVLFIDGAYLLRHRNTRLDRFTRAAENVELIKRACTDLEMMAFCSWQFNREASKKQKKGKGEQGDLEDIGYSDAIGQISSIALSLFQEDSVETMKQRKIQVMKGRNGEVGQFTIAWDFVQMSFAQTYPTIDPVTKIDDAKELQWV